MKITFFIGCLYGGGAERVTCNLANYFVQKGHQVNILVMSETEKTYFLDSRIKKVPLLSIKQKKHKLFKTFIRFVRFIIFLLTNRCDVYIVMLPKTIILMMLFKWLTNSKIIISERNSPDAYSKLLLFLLKYCASKADGVVFQTEGALIQYDQAVNIRKYIVIPNAVNNSFIRPLFQGKRLLQIVGVGRLNKQKNFSLLIKSFYMLAKEFPNYNLIIFGEGRERTELEYLINKFSLENRVFLPGNIQNIPETIEKQSLFVLSSNFEGIPNTLIEAMALGLPCISTDCPSGGPRQLIQNGINGLLVPIQDADSLANAIRLVLNNNEMGKRLGNEARRIVDSLNPEIVYKKWEDFVLSICLNKT